MELWLSAEVQQELSEPLRRARAQISRVISSQLTADYGGDVREWALITILRPRVPEGWGEVCRYHPDRQVAEFRLLIDFDSFKAAAPEEQTKMLLASLLRSIDLAPRLMLRNFDLSRLRCDI